MQCYCGARLSAVVLVDADGPCSVIYHMIYRRLALTSILRPILDDPCKSAPHLQKSPPRRNHPYNSISPQAFLDQTKSKLERRAALRDTLNVLCEKMPNSWLATYKSPTPQSQVEAQCQSEREKSKISQLPVVNVSDIS